MATVRYPIRYELRPERLAEGHQWVHLSLENLSDEPITAVAVRLNSQDPSRIRVHGADSYVPALLPEEAQEVGFEVGAEATSSVYISLEGEHDGAPFRWESPYIPLVVGEELARVVSLVATNAPYPPVGEKMRCEVVVRAYGESDGLRLELWVDTPGGDFERLIHVATGRLLPGDTPRYTGSFTPEEAGAHTLYAYLYDGVERIDRRIQHVYVS